MINHTVVELKTDDKLKIQVLRGTIQLQEMKSSYLEAGGFTVDTTGFCMIFVIIKSQHSDKLCFFSFFMSVD